MTVTVAIYVAEPTFTPGGGDPCYSVEPCQETGTLDSLASAVRAWVDAGTRRSRLTAWQTIFDPLTGHVVRGERCEWDGESWSAWRVS